MKKMNKLNNSDKKALFSFLYKLSPYNCVK